MGLPSCPTDTASIDEAFTLAKDAANLCLAATQMHITSVSFSDVLGLARASCFVLFEVAASDRLLLVHRHCSRVREHSRLANVLRL